MNICQQQHCNNNRLGILVWMFTDGALCSVAMGTAMWDIWPSGVRSHLVNGQRKLFYCIQNTGLAKVQMVVRGQGGLK
jgi:hypothetical protein